MTYEGNSVEILSMDSQTAVIRCDGSVLCVGISDLKEEKKKTKSTKAASGDLPPVKSKK